MITEENLPMRTIFLRDHGPEQQRPSGTDSAPRSVNTTCLSASPRHQASHWQNFRRRLFHDHEDSWSSWQPKVFVIMLLDLREEAPP
jgi:hypothetical protein